MGGSQNIAIPHLRDPMNHALSVRGLSFRISPNGTNVALLNLLVVGVSLPQVSDALLLSEHLDKDDEVCERELFSGVTVRG